MELKRADIKNVEIHENCMEFFAENGMTAKIRFCDFARLKNADQSVLRNYSLGLFGIRWESLDEDISYDSIFFPERFPLSGVLRD